MLLSNLKSFLTVQSSETEGVPIEVSKTNINISSLQISDDVVSGDSSVFSVAYVAGFIFKHLSKHIHECQICSDNLSSDYLALHNVFISYKEWTESEHRLTYPSENLTVAVGHGITILKNFLDLFAFQPAE